MLTFVAIFALSLQFILALVVYVNNRRRLRNIAFALLSLSLFAWSALNYANSTPALRDNLPLMRSIMFFVVLQNIFFALFAISLRRERIRFTKRVAAYAVLSLVTASLTLSPVLFTKVLTGKYGPYPAAGPGMLFFIIHAFLSISIGFRNLVRARRAVAGLQRNQLAYIWFGSVVLWGLVPLTNFVLSLTLQTSFFYTIQPYLCACVLKCHSLCDCFAAAVRYPHSGSSLRYVSSHNRDHDVVVWHFAFRGREHTVCRPAT